MVLKTNEYTSISSDPLIVNTTYFILSRYKQLMQEVILLNRYFTMGMAGHNEQGKTSLTKALTGVSTDSLKEEQTRKISIEPGFAPFIHEDDLEVSIIDVPGHENFIRQMIAGVAGIDLVTIVIAADEGIMPQTKEHLAILSLLGINNGVIVITKMSLANEELLEIILEDIKSTVKDTFLKNEI